MTVSEMLVKMQTAAARGHGSLPLVIVETASGVTHDVSCYGNHRELEAGEFEGGPLVEEKPGFKYVPIYT